MFAFLSYFSVSAMIYVCGNYKGGKECHVFKGKCDHASNLTALGAHFPGGWTCINFGLVTGGDVHVVQENTGRAFVIINGEKTSIGSDAFVNFIAKMKKESGQTRAAISDEQLQKKYDDFFKTDNGRVSDFRVKEIAQELGVKIEYQSKPIPKSKN